MDLFESIGIGINLRLCIGIWYRYDFWVSVSGISIGMDLGYWYRYLGIGGALPENNPMWY